MELYRIQYAAIVRAGTKDHDQRSSPLQVVLRTLRRANAVPLFDDEEVWRFAVCDCKLDANEASTITSQSVPLDINVFSIKTSPL